MEKRRRIKNYGDEGETENQSNKMRTETKSRQERGKTRMVQQERKTKGMYDIEEKELKQGARNNMRTAKHKHKQHK